MSTSNSPTSSFAEAALHLETEGLNWLAYADAAAGPPDAEIAPHQGVLLLLGLGGTFAERTVFDNGSPNPIDEQAIGLVAPFVEQVLRPNDAAARLVYPQANRSVNLMAWLSAAKAQYPSRLGIGIRPDCGSWFAVRAAVVTHLPDATRRWLTDYYPPLDAAATPCDECRERPCESACPASAPGANFNLDRCMTQRLTTGSVCGDRCAARLACPVGANFRYPEALLTYHYGVSLKMLQRWSSRK